MEKKHQDRKNMTNPYESHDVHWNVHWNLSHFRHFSSSFWRLPALPVPSLPLPPAVAGGAPPPTPRPGGPAAAPAAPGLRQAQQQLTDLLGHFHTIRCLKEAVGAVEVWLGMAGEYGWRW